jgi:hypothetical protein
MQNQQSKGHFDNLHTDLVVLVTYVVLWEVPERGSSDPGRIIFMGRVNRHRYVRRTDCIAKTVDDTYVPV